MAVSSLFDAYAGALIFFGNLTSATISFGFSKEGRFAQINWVKRFYPLSAGLLAASLILLFPKIRELAKLDGISSLPETIIIHALAAASIAVAMRLVWDLLSVFDKEKT